MLLRPKTPKAGGRVFLEWVPPLWRALSFTYKVTVRNLLRYKKRFLMTIVGIGGCTALLVTGFGIKDSLADISRNQFGELYKYDFRARFSASASNKNIQDVYAAMNAMPEVARVLGVYSKMMDAGPVGGGSAVVTLVALSDAERLGDFITLRERISRRSLGLYEVGAVVSEKFARNHNLAVGDAIYLKDGDKRVAQGYTVQVFARPLGEFYVEISR